ncbi:hypothetical protein HDU93_001332 [Gonapodya sp. JEL0774]|nr:hypothetical protein HDU93_001332 [Gonapodya sp. JEL0774]
MAESAGPPMTAFPAITSPLTVMATPETESLPIVAPIQGVTSNLPLDPLIIEAALKDFKDKLFVTKVENDFLALLSEAKIADYYSLSHRYERSRDTLIVARKIDSVIPPIRIIDIVVSNASSAPPAVAEPPEEPRSTQNGDLLTESHGGDPSKPRSGSSDDEKENEKDCEKTSDPIKSASAGPDQSSVALAAQVRIMRREGNNRSPSVDKDDQSVVSGDGTAGTGNGTNGRGSQSRSIEERERAYQEARARIFKEDATTGNDTVDASTGAGSQAGQATQSVGAFSSSLASNSQSLAQTSGVSRNRSHLHNSEPAGGPVGTATYAPHLQKPIPWTNGTDHGYPFQSVRPFPRPGTFGYTPIYPAGGFVGTDMDSAPLLYSQPYSFPSAPQTAIEPSSVSGNTRDLGRSGQVNSSSPGFGVGNTGVSGRKAKFRNNEGEQFQAYGQQNQQIEQRIGPSASRQAQGGGKRYSGGNGAGARSWSQQPTNPQYRMPLPHGPDGTGALQAGAVLGGVSMPGQVPSHPGFSYHGLHPPQPYFRFAGPPTTYYYPALPGDPSLTQPQFAYSAFPVDEHGHPQPSQIPQQFALQQAGMSASYPHYAQQYYDQARPPLSPGGMAVRFDGIGTMVYPPPGVPLLLPSPQEGAPGPAQNEISSGITTNGQHGQSGQQNFAVNGAPDLPADMNRLRIG